MKPTMFATLAAAALITVCCRGANESHNSSQAGATARAGSANPSGQPAVTLTGCLQNADRPDTATGTMGTRGTGSSASAADQMAAGAGSPGERFTLTRAKSASADSNPAAGSYILDGNMESMREHLDQQVRVEGTLDAAAANTAGPQRIRVQRVETIASRCAPK
jgi:hypothetical protein